MYHARRAKLDQVYSPQFRGQTQVAAFTRGNSEFTEITCHFIKHFAGSDSTSENSSPLTSWNLSKVHHFTHTPMILKVSVESLLAAPPTSLTPLGCNTQAQQASSPATVHHHHHSRRPCSLQMEAASAQSSICREETGQLCPPVPSYTHKSPVSSLDCISNSSDVQFFSLISDMSSWFWKLRQHKFRRCWTENIMQMTRNESSLRNTLTSITNIQFTVRAVRETVAHRK